MSRMLSVFVFPPVVVAALSFPLFSAAAPLGVGVVSSQSNIFYGGGISAGSGAIDYVELSPMIGMHLDARSSVGATFLYRYRSDKRNGRKITTHDYGASLFARYRITPSFYLEADYEYLDHESLSAASSRERRQYYGFLGGGGVSTPIGGTTAMYMSVLYNFTYDERDHIYSEPWVFRFGISVGFH